MLLTKNANILALARDPKLEQRYVVSSSRARVEGGHLSRSQALSLIPRQWKGTGNEASFFFLSGGLGEGLAGKRLDFISHS